MYLLISPAKSQDFDHSAAVSACTQVQNKALTQKLVQALADMTPGELRDLLGVSEKLAVLNTQRFQVFDSEYYGAENAKQALFAYQGDVYKSLAAENFSEDDAAFAQAHLGIISGLYGLLRPLDLIQPYRLEMNAKLANPAGKDLYAFWGDILSEQVNTLLVDRPDEPVINLASKAYSKAVLRPTLNHPVINVEFKEHRAGTYKVVAVMAKRARGLMARFVIKHRLQQPSELEQFCEAGYGFRTDLSTPSSLVFVREAA